jgi:hypothetical protein
MKYYELTIILKNLPDPEKIISSLPIQPVKEQKGSNFLTLEFYAEPEKIHDLEKALKANSLRYMILVKEPQKERKSRQPRFKKPSFAKASEDKEKKVDLKEIDKKIEEMLKE